MQTSGLLLRRCSQVSHTVMHSQNENGLNTSRRLCLSKIPSSLVEHFLSRTIIFGTLFLGMRTGSALHPFVNP